VRGFRIEPLLVVPVLGAAPPVEAVASIAA
jgi:hypothetical protein